MYDAPVKVQNTKANMCDQDTTTDLSNNVIEFIASGAQKYE